MGTHDRSPVILSIAFEPSATAIVEARTAGVDRGHGQAGFGQRGADGFPRCEFDERLREQDRFSSEPGAASTDPKNRKTRGL